MYIAGDEPALPESLGLGPAPKNVAFPRKTAADAAQGMA
jgi:hypothetical protein